mgnify:CR=1 FL=1
MQTKLQELSNSLFSNQRTMPVETSLQRGLIYSHGDTELGLKMLIEGLEIYLRGQADEHKHTAGRDKDFQRVVSTLSDSILALLDGKGQFHAPTCQKALELIRKEYVDTK